ncbi:MAG: hypothetical protein CM1200mP14_28280 [Gammaproteobacteria bacterium]|nr:MAG: hypothetical protein CM1200mP14_28280 [Gammaproteobacteria bacterium]
MAKCSLKFVPGSFFATNNALALAEFQFTLTRADAPIDRFARGDHDAMTVDQKRGHFCSSLQMCGHLLVRSATRLMLSEEMFSDFEPHVLAVPQVFQHFVMRGLTVQVKTKTTD